MEEMKNTWIKIMLIFLFFGTGCLELFKNEEEEPDYGITSGFINSSAYNATFLIGKIYLKELKWQKN